MADLISEPIEIVGATDTSRMAQGEPGLPAGFRWRGVCYDILAVARAWKVSSREGGRPTGDLYLRRHGYELHMSDDSVWSVYFVRQTPKTGNPKQRWFLYTRTEKNNTDGVAAE